MPSPPPAAAQHGIYFDCHGAGPEDNTKFIDHPPVDGAFVRFAWRAIEADAGEYDFSVIEDTIRPWRKAKKRLIIGIALAGQHHRTGPRVDQGANVPHKEQPE